MRGLIAIVILTGGIAGAAMLRPPSAQSCSADKSVVRIRGNGPEWLDSLKQAIERSNVVIQLGPDVDLDFTSYDKLPLYFGRCVTLTSVASFKPSRPVHRPRPRAEAPAPRPGNLPDVAIGDRDLEIDASDPVQPVEARSPKRPGPAIRYRGPTLSAFIILRCNDTFNADGTRISGFRLFGPKMDDQDRGDTGILVEHCIDIEISNMEVAGWGGSGISVTDEGPDVDPASGAVGGRISRPDQVRIHDNYLHHNMHAQTGGFPITNWGGSAAGYGASVGPGAWASIYRNVFDNNRHAIAANGKAGGYDARENLALKGGGYHGVTGNNWTHLFDIHGTDCAGQMCGDAADQAWFFFNSFQYTNDASIKIRGTPRVEATISRNVFAKGYVSDAVKLRSRTHVKLTDDNVAGFDSYGKYGVCDFDGDGIDDLFLPTGATWWFSSMGEFPWSWLNQKVERLAQVRLGYFDDDDQCDVLTEQSGQWLYASGGKGGWISLGRFGVPLADVVLGQFDLPQPAPVPGRTRRTTGALHRAADGTWRVTSLKSPNWERVQQARWRLDQMQFGDFTGDGVTDVIGYNDGVLSISESARSRWRPFNRDVESNLGELLVANMDPDDNADDLLRIERDSAKAGTTTRYTISWWRARNGSGTWTRYAQHEFTYLNSARLVRPVSGFAGRFSTAPGGGTMIIDPNRIGHFYSAAEQAVGANPAYTSTVPY